MCTCQLVYKRVLSIGGSFCSLQIRAPSVSTVAATTWTLCFWRIQVIHCSYVCINQQILQCAFNFVNPNLNASGRGFRLCTNNGVLLSIVLGKFVNEQWDMAGALFEWFWMTSASVSSCNETAVERVYDYYAVIDCWSIFHSHFVFTYLQPMCVCILSLVSHCCCWLTTITRGRLKTITVVHCDIFIGAF